MGDITRNFSWYEMVCKCGECSGKPDNIEAFKKEVGWLQTIRDIYGKPIHINSGYRCPSYNNKIATTGLTGPHTVGAFDIACWGTDTYNLILIAQRLGATGIGISQKGPRESRYVHLDRLGGSTRPWIWSY